jgi:hypothetical protein
LNESLIIIEVDIVNKQKTDENIFIRREEEINKERLRAKSIKDEAQSEIARKILRDELTNHISGRSQG